ncbi:hypothetical protein E4U55_002496 [Claviceps digitariae]|nr:hypothetical protein E4U55_002496 [Claviceps digitariae]
MQYLTLLLAAAAAVSAAAVPGVEPRMSWGVFCSGKFTDPMYCGPLQASAWCCKPEEGGKFTNAQQPIASGKGYYDDTGCDGDGHVYCISN